MAIPKNISVQDFRQAKFDENVLELELITYILCQIWSSIDQ